MDFLSTSRAAQSNGFVENAVKQVKNLLGKCKKDDSDPLSSKRSISRFSSSAIGVEGHQMCYSHCKETPYSHSTQQQYRPLDDFAVTVIALGRGS